MKQVSKPLATQLKLTAQESPVLRGYVTRLGQAMHEYNARLAESLKSDSERGARRVFVTKLDDETALKKAADFLGEIFIFSLAAGAVVYEVNASSVKDAAKAEKAKAEKEALRGALDDVAATLRDTLRSVQALDARLAAVEAEAQRRAAASRGWLWRRTVWAADATAAQPLPAAAAAAPVAPALALPG